MKRSIKLFIRQFRRAAAVSNIHARMIRPRLFCNFANLRKKHGQPTESRTPHINSLPQRHTTSSAAKKLANMPYYCESPGLKGDY